MTPAPGADRPRILVLAYACEPHKGSEPGAGWTWARLVSHLGDTWVVTRSNNRASIEGEIDSIPEGSRLTFSYVDLPRWARWWKRGSRGVRLYYLLWQFAALKEAKRLRRDVGFDAVWHVTLANTWMGSVGCLVGPPFIFGPVGGGIGIAWRFLPGLGFRGIVSELGRSVIRNASRLLNPLTRMSWARARLILVQNEQGRTWLPPRHRAKAVVLPNAMLEEADTDTSHPVRELDKTHRAIFAGRLLPVKGVGIAIAAIARTPGWRLIVCGDGPERSRLEDLARKEGVEERVEWRGWVDRPEVLRTMREESSVFIFPSLHDEAPLAVADAIAAGLPVLCTDLSGARVVAGAAGVVVPAPDPKTAIEGLAERLNRDEWPAVAEIARRAQELSFNSRLEAIRALDPLGVSGEPVG